MRFPKSKLGWTQKEDSRPGFLAACSFSRRLHSRHTVKGLTKARSINTMKAMLTWKERWRKNENTQPSTKIIPMEFGSLPQASKSLSSNVSWILTPHSQGYGWHPDRERDTEYLHKRNPPLVGLRWVQSRHTVEATPQLRVPSPDHRVSQSVQEENCKTKREQEVSYGTNQLGVFEWLFLIVAFIATCHCSSPFSEPPFLIFLHP